MACRHGRLENLQPDILTEALLPKLSPSDKGRLASTSKSLRGVICTSVTKLICTSMDLSQDFNSIERAAATFTSPNIELYIALPSIHVMNLASLLRAFAPSLKALCFNQDLDDQLQHTATDRKWALASCLHELEVNKR